MSADLQAIQTAYAAYQKGDLDTARALLEPVQAPQAQHLLGLVERRAGRYDLAATYLEIAAKADPHNHEIANNQGRVACDAGQAQAAEAHFHRALKLRPGWPTALEGLARSLNDQKRWIEATKIWQQIEPQMPGTAAVQYGTAMAELETGAVESALGRYQALIANGLKDPAVWFMRSRARLELGDVAGGLSDLYTAWSAQPSPHVLRNLANTLWMSGDHQAFDTLLSNVPNTLAVLSILIRHEAGQTETAIRTWDALADAEKASSVALIARARIASDLGDVATAYDLAERALHIDGENPTVLDAAICGRLMRGEAEAALALIMPQRRRDPLNQHWIGHQATALRLLGDPRYDVLVQIDAHVRTYELPVPPGFASLTEFNAALAAAIKPIRSFTTHPLDQSFKLGAQTSRDLATVPDPVIAAYIKALDAPIRQYLADIGQASDHPLTQRNTGDYRFNGCWSVELKGGGRHVNHVHPKGWISSAYYVSVPEETLSGASRAGWIKFAEPAFETAPKLEPQKWIQPEAGRLVLFPSYLWHGTAPISDGERRVTAPFDLVPA